MDVRFADAQNLRHFAGPQSFITGQHQHLPLPGRQARGSARRSSRPTRVPRPPTPGLRRVGRGSRRLSRPCSAAAPQRSSDRERLRSQSDKTTCETAIGPGTSRCPGRRGTTHPAPPLPPRPPRGQTHGKSQCLRQVLLHESRKQALVAGQCHGVASSGADRRPALSIRRAKAAKLKAADKVSSCRRPPTRTTGSPTRCGGCV